MKKLLPDLPTSDMSEDNLPGKGESMSGLGGDEIPAGLAFASSHYQPERLVGRIEDGESNDAGFAFTVAMSISQQAVVSRGLTFGDKANFLSLFAFERNRIAYANSCFRR